MKILVVSDSHGYNTQLFNAMDSEKPIDMLIHCGDSGDLGLSRCDGPRKL